MSAPGTLYVVATPIGNLGDLSPRAREVLAAADCVAAEDTRHSGRLLAHFGIERPLVSLHEHNEAGRVRELLARLQAGQSVALVSDAGTPLIADPGYRLVAAVRAAGIRVVPLPGPCAAIAALAVAGRPTDRVCFAGFLPPRPSARRERLRALAAETRTLVFYEAPHRLREFLDDCAAGFGATRRAFVARELTKLHESTYDGTLGELATRAALEADLLRGEAVVVIEGAPEAADTGEATGRGPGTEVLLAALLDELPASRAVDLVVKLTGARRNAVYRRALELRGTQGAEPDEPG
ncbi:MAG: 16S rRNA (cytidine(1402)-2'-O)-methyltransferase [Pseudomonadota bacterium]